MSTFKRFLAWTLVVISVIGILACSFIVIGSWLINDDITNRILTLLTTVQENLSSVENSLTTASANIQTANSAVNTIREAAASLGNNVEENTPILDKITGAFDDQLYPAIKRIQDLFLPILDRIVAINNTIEALNTFPGINLPTLTLELEQLNDQIQSVVDTVQQLQANIADFKTGIVENFLTPFLAKLDTVASFLARLEQDINTYLGQVKLVKDAVADLQARIPATIDSITIWLSVFLVWAILGQISLILLASLYLRTGQMVWKLNRPEQPEIEAVSQSGN